MAWKTGTINLSSDKKDYQYLSSYDTAADAAAAEKELAIKLQEEGSVLLKGSPSTLQVAGDKKVTLFGMRSYMAQYGGSIGSTVSKAETIRLDQAPRGVRIFCQSADGKVLSGSG